MWDPIDYDYDVDADDYDRAYDAAVEMDTLDDGWYEDWDGPEDES